MDTIEVPEPVRLRAEADGETGRAWLAELPSLVAGLERDWGLVAGVTLHGGTGGYLAEATLADGTPAVLKLGMPSDEMAGEMAVLERAGGRGYARLIRRDVGRRAMLVQRLGPRLSQSGLCLDDQMTVICATLREAWTAVASPEVFQTGAEKARWLIDFIRETWEAADRPCSERAVAYALACAQSRLDAFDPAACVLVHGDAHAENTLAAADSPSGYKFVDPDGLFAEPACDLAIPMREWSEDLLAGDALAQGLARAERLADLTGVDAQAIWRWGAVERMSTGLLATRLGYQPAGREMLAVAEAWAGGPLA